MLDGQLEPGSLTNSDKDSLTDWEEVDKDSSIIGWQFGKPVFPTAKSITVFTKGYDELCKYDLSVLTEYLDSLLIVPFDSDPTMEDSDDDGLNDGKAQYNDNNEIIAPKDDTPLDYSGPKGAWKQYIKDSKKDAPTELEGWYNFTPIDIPVEYLIPLSGLLSLAEIEGMQVFIQEAIYILVTESDIYNNSKFLAFVTLSAIARCQDKMEDAYFYLQKAINEMNPFLTTKEFNKYAAMLGSSFLNFKEDKNHVLHSQTRTWQALGGYNNTYDGLFSFFTNQNNDKEKFAFTAEATEYIIWIWRGDYLNLGAGAEIGIYARPSSMSQDPDKLDHYFAFYNNAMPMSLSLYNSLGKGIYENIYSWNPTEDQWWCCGFNPEYIGNVDVHRQVMVGRLDMSEFSDEGGNNYMFDSLEFRISSNDELSKYMYFDDNSQTVWIIWGDDI